jgi:hypothetical protein
MKLNLVIDRIETGALGFKHVSGVKTVADLDTTPAPMPACFVLPATETIVPKQEGAGLIMLEATFSFDVVCLIQGSAQRGRDENELMDLKDVVIDRLLGWTPDPSIYRPIVPTAGRLLGLAAGRASWITRFRTVFAYRKQG